MDGTALATLFDLLGGKAIDFLCLLGILWLARGQRAHERHCRERNREHYAATEKLQSRVSRIEGRLEIDAGNDG